MEIVSGELRNAGIDNAEFEARELLGAALKTDCRCASFLKMLECSVSGKTAAGYLELAGRRKKGEPLQYILGEWEFYGLPFKVGKGVLIPRQDTETLVDHAAEKYRGKSGLTVIDLCSGSGCIGIALEKSLSCERVLCIEKSYEALKYLKANKTLNNSAAEIIQGDVLDSSVVSEAPDADLIICNPPYLTSEDMKKLQREVGFEPKSALYGGEDGLDFYRSITRLWKSRIKPSGMMIFEIGIGQENDVMDIMIRHGFKNVRAKKDMCGIYRATVGEYYGN